MLPLLTPRWRLSLLLFLTLLLGASCQNARLAFQFRRPASGPVPLVLASAPAAVAPAAEHNPENTSPAVLVLPAPRAGRKSAAHPRPVPRLAAWAAAAPIPFPTPPLAGNRPGRLVRVLGLLSPRRPARPAAGPAEVGLGTTFLGILGIVALLVGLVGLIFAGWGFFGWLAVGGALALLISILAPYISGHA